MQDGAGAPQVHMGTCSVNVVAYNPLTKLIMLPGPMLYINIASMLHFSRQHMLLTCLQVAIPDAELGTRQTGGDVGMNLRVDIRVDAEQRTSGLANLLCCRHKISKVKFRVNIDEHTVLHCKLKLPWQLAVPIQDSPSIEWLHAFEVQTNHTTQLIRSGGYLHLGVKASSLGQLKLSTGDQHSTAALLLQMPHDWKVVVSLHRVPNNEF
eukprot:353182-Chlamydomonas_euryale.AAC.39